MIGQLVERILAAGFDVNIIQRNDMIVIGMRGFVGKELYGVDWAISCEGITYGYPERLLESCDGYLQRLQKTIEEKKAERGEEQPE